MRTRLLILVVGLIGFGLSVAACTDNSQVKAELTPPVYAINSVRADPADTRNMNILTPPASILAQLAANSSATAKAAPPTTAVPASIALTPAGGTPAPGASPAPGGGGTAAGGSSAAAGDLQAGLAAFGAKGCSACHANNGLAAGIGPKLAGVGAKGDQYITTRVRQGKGTMPAFGTDKVSATDLANLIAYIKSLK